MQTIFNNKYRISTTRAKWHNYQNGAYFATICTKNRIHYFGEIVDGKMVLSEIGIIANQCIIDTNKHFPDANVPVYVIMPDHIHAIITINSQDNDRDAKFCVSTTKQKFGPQSKNLASIVRGIKIGVTKYAKNNDIPFEWQRLYYDSIIQDTNDMKRITKYINDNVKKWNNDNHSNRMS